nr:MAG TPA: hypothetical protein [Caudoviricetes sp.]
MLRWQNGCGYACTNSCKLLTYSIKQYQPSQ